MNIPMFKVFMAQDVSNLVSEVLNSGYVGQGPKVDELEEILSNYLGNPYINTVNSGTSALHLALHLIKTEGRDEVLTTPLTCLYGESPVSLPDGKTMSIKKMVESKYNGLVNSFNVETGKVERKKVIGWHKVPRDNKKWIRVSWESSPSCRESVSHRRGVWVTQDHLVLTTDGYKFAEDLHNHKVVIAERNLNPKQQSFMIGTLLGDGFLRTSHRIGSRRFRFGSCHAATQSEWINLKRDILKDFEHSIKDRPAYKQSGPRIDLTLGFSSIWKKWADRFYKNGIKVVPKDIHNLDDIALATWFMDDGSRQNNSIVLCTESFDQDSVERLIVLLGKRGIVGTLQKHRSGTYRIYIGNSPARKMSATKFFNIVAPYILPSLRYKLPHAIESSLPYNSDLWNLGNTVPFVDQALLFEGVPNGKKHKTEYVYCIDVEDNHNFISSDVVLHNCTATNFPILANGLKIRWVDVDENTFNLDLVDLRRKISPKTAAIMAVHWGGCPVDLNTLRDIQDECYDLYGFRPPVIEDCAHAMGATYHGKLLGNHGNLCMFSFQAIKHFTTVDGGMLVVPSDEMHQRAKLLRWYGLDRTRSADFRCEQNIREWGYKFQMNDMTAAVGLGNFPHLEYNLARHRANGGFYNQTVPQIPGVLGVQSYATRYTSAYWVYTLRLANRDGFMRKMKEHGIAVSRVHDRNDKHPCLKEFKVPLPSTDKVCNEMCCIPCGWWVAAPEREYIVDCMSKGW